MDVRQIRVDRSSESEDENNTFDYINLIEKTNGIEFYTISSVA